MIVERPPGQALLLLAAAPLFAVAIFYALDLSRATLLMPWIGWGAAAGLAPALLAWRRETRRPAEIGPWIVAAVLVALFVFQLRGSDTLPAHDHLTPLAIGRAIAERGTALHHAYSTEASLPAYPPGLGVLTAPFFRLLGDVATIGAYTWIAATSVALVPLTWATLLRRLYLPAAPLWPIAVAMAAGFFLFDRTLMNAAIYAGKNAFFSAALLVPIAVTLLIEGVGDRRREVLAGLACLGAVVIHYSAAYMLSCLIAAWLLVERPPARIWFRLGAVGAAVLVLFLPLALHTEQHAMVLIAQGKVATSGRFLLGTLQDKYSDFLFIYHQFAKLKLLPWPWKGWTLVACVLLLGAIAALAARRRAPMAGYILRLARFAATLLLAATIAAVLASGLIPRVGIDSLYVSWFLFFFLAPIFAATVLGLWACAKAGARSPAARGAASLLLLAGFALGGFAFADDYLKARRHALRNATTKAELAEFRGLLRDFEGRGLCYLAIQGGAVDGSAIMPGITQVTHANRPLDYAPLLADCAALTGSFTTSPFKGGRDVGGYPTAELLAALPNGAAVLFIGSESDLRRYLAALPGLAAGRLDRQVGWYGVYELRRPKT